MDQEAAALLDSPPGASISPRREQSLDRARRPSTRRTRRAASDGSSPLAGGLPYSGRPFCEYN